VNRVTEKENQIPSLYEWLGGVEVLNALMVKFYERVSADELLRPLFGDMPADLWARCWEDRQPTP
jgi:hemoglobin